MNTRISGDNFLNTRTISQLNMRKKEDVPSNSVSSAPISTDKFDCNLENYLDAEGFKVNENGLSSVIIEGKEPEEVAKKKEEIVLQGGHVEADLPIIGGFSAEIPPKEILRIARKGTLAVIPDGDMHAYLDVASSVVGASTINNKGFTGKGVTVAVIDTGIAPHKDLSDQKTGQSRIIGFKDFCKW